MGKRVRNERDGPPLLVFGGFERTMNEYDDNKCGDEMRGDLGLRISEWKDIPVELLLRVLSLADDQTVIVASEVCRGWREAISWGLTHLSLSWCKKNMNDLVLSLVPKFTEQQALILRQDTPQLQDGAVEKIASNCHGLQELDLSKSFRLSDCSLYALAHGCPSLAKLNISGCSAFRDTALGFLTGLCRILTFLNLCGCVKAATDRVLKAIGYNCNKLQSLNLGRCDQVGDAGVKSLAYGCSDLRALDLCGCVLITDDSVIALANNCRHLRSLARTSPIEPCMLCHRAEGGTSMTWRITCKRRKGLLTLTSASALL